MGKNPLASIRKRLAWLRTPVGRAKLALRTFVRTWPILRLAAMGYHRIMRNTTRVIAVVGSQGKTTTTRAVSAVLGLSDRPCLKANSGSYLALGILRIRPRDEYAVLEVGIGRKRQMRKYAKTIRPDIAVVTSISSEHHTAFGDLDTTRMEKSAMVRALPPAGLAVLNGDDPNVLWMRGQTRARVLTYGFSPDCDIRAVDAAIDWPAGTRFRLRAAGKELGARTGLIGRVYVYAILAAVAVGLEAGRDLEAILADLERLPPTPGRLEPVVLDSGAVLLRDDFKSALETIEVALDVMAEIPARRKIVILGEISEPPQGKAIHRELGRRIADIATLAIFIGTSKSCQAYSAGAAGAGMPRGSVVKAGNEFRAAISALPADLGHGDVVLIKGRNDQRLQRIVLALAGRAVRCDLPYCHTLNTIHCDSCPMLERGWAGLRVQT